MLKPLLTAFYSLLASLVFGQGIAPVQIGDGDTKNFPWVTLTMKDRNPETKDASLFDVIEDGQSIDSIEVTSITADSIASNQAILIVMEALATSERRPQMDYFKAMLAEAIPRFVKPGDQVAVAIFGRPPSGHPLLEYLDGAWTDDAQSLAYYCQNLSIPNDNYHDDDDGYIGQAIHDGIQDLVALESGLPMQLVVLSEERASGKDNAAKDYQELGEMALENKVSVYTMKYNRSGWGGHRINTVASSSYGLSYVRDRSEDGVNSGSSWLERAMEDAIKRSNGNLYKVDFKTKASQDGEFHVVTIQIDQQEAPAGFNAPAPTFMDWVSENWLILAIVFVMLIIIVWLLVSRARKEKERLEAESLAQQQKVAAMAKEQEQSQGELEAQKNQLNQIRARERQQEEEAQAKRRAEEAQAREEALLKQMEQAGNLPHLKVSSNEGIQRLDITLPVITLGRDAGNHHQLNHPTVSRKHLQFRFVDGNYLVEDLKSANGTLLNGYPLTDSTPIKHGDVLQIGELLITYYR